MSEATWARSEAWGTYADGKKAGAGALLHQDLLERMARYRREVAKRYRIANHEMIGRLLPEGNFTISTKLDGELWFLVKRGGDVVLTASNGRILRATALVREAERRLADAADALVAGELVAIPKEGRPRVQHVASALSSSELEPTLRFFPFDLLHEGEVDWQARSYKDRLARLGSWFGEASAETRVSPVTSVVGTAADVASYFRAWVDTQTCEGLVVRAESGLTFKVKPTFTIDAVVVAYGDRRTSASTPSELRELTLALLNDDGTFQIIGPVGGGFEGAARLAWRERLAALEVPSSFRMANREGTLCRFVKPEIVVEVKCSDLLETDANDAPIARMALRYDAATGYAAVGDARVPALLFPVFVRERTDKTVDVASVGKEQLTSRLPSDLLAWDRKAGSLAEATVVRRSVWTKSGGAVRKYVLIQTNKTRSEGYAPFVVYFTDFAIGRAEPLKTSVRVAATLESAERQVAAWVTENVKRGWNAVGAPGLETLPTNPSAETSDASEAAPAKPKAKRTPAAKKPKPEPEA